jgi:hypothetical protein
VTSFRFVTLGTIELPGVSGIDPAASASSRVLQEEAHPMKLLMKLALSALTAAAVLAQEVPPVGTASAVPMVGENLTVTAWTDKTPPEAAVGDVLKVSFRTNAEALCYVVVVGTTGKSDLLFPNKKESDNKVAPDMERTVPGQAGYRIRVAGPPGNEVVIVVASRKAIPVYESLSLIAPRKLAGPLTLSGAVSRDLSLEADAAAQAPVDLEAFLAELERAGQVARGRDLAHAVVVLKVKEGAGPGAAPEAAAPPPPSGEPTALPPTGEPTALPPTVPEAPAPEPVASPAATNP